MEREVSQQIGAERSEQSSKRPTQRTGSRERTGETRVGAIDFPLPKLPPGAYSLSLLEPGRRAEQARLAVIQQACMEGVSVRRVDDLLKALGLTGIDTSAVSRLCQQRDGVVEQVRQRPLQAMDPSLWVDAGYRTVRQTQRMVVSAAVVSAMGAKKPVSVR